MSERSLLLKMPSDMYDMLKEEATKKTISVSALIRLIFIEYFKKE